MAQSRVPAHNIQSLLSGRALHLMMQPNQLEKKFLSLDPDQHHHQTRGRDVATILVQDLDLGNDCALHMFHIKIADLL